jgi:hypothetical protein
MHIFARCLVATSLLLSALALATPATAATFEVENRSGAAVTLYRNGGTVCEGLPVGDKHIPSKGMAKFFYEKRDQYDSHEFILRSGDRSSPSCTIRFFQTDRLSDFVTVPRQGGKCTDRLHGNSAYIVWG